MSRNAYYLESAIIRILQTEGKWQELTEFLFSLSQ